MFFSLLNLFIAATGTFFGLRYAGEKKDKELKLLFQVFIVILGLESLLYLVMALALVLPQD